jgi:hypothetical protein
MEQTTNIQQKTISQLMDMVPKEKHHPATIPYYQVMKQIDVVEIHGLTYGSDTYDDIIRRWLVNAQYMRGPEVKAVKAELNRRLKS